MSKYEWETRDDGVILVSADGGPYLAPVLHDNAAGLMDRIEAKWGDKCRVIGGRYGLHDGWLQAGIHRESGGNERAFRQERDKNGQPIVSSGRLLTGIGLLQITNPGLKGNHTDEELYDPELNLDIGARYLASKKVKYNGDFVRSCIAFNAGSLIPTDQNPWGYVHTSGHASAEVAALNYYLSRALSDEDKTEILAKVYVSNSSSVDEFTMGSPFPVDEEPPATVKNS